MLGTHNTKCAIAARGGGKSRRSRRAWKVGAAASILIATGALAAPEYTVVEIPPFDNGIWSWALGINQRGQVGGWASSGVAAKGLMWSAGTVELCPPIPGRDNSTVFHVTDSDPPVAVGLSRNMPNYDAVAVMWKDEEVLNLHDHPTWPCSWFYAANENLQAAGFMFDPDSSDRIESAMVWESDTGMVDISTDYKAGTANDINDRGWITGNIGPSEEEWEAAVWQKVGDEWQITHHLGTLGGPKSYAHAISDQPIVEVVGGADVAPQVMRPFLWRDDGNGMINLGDLEDFDNGMATEINKHGLIVGFFWNGTEWAAMNGKAFAYRYNRMMAIEKLVPYSGWQFREAWAVNDAGQIVGRGHNPAGQQRAYILTPIPLLSKPDPGLAGVDNTLRICGAIPTNRITFVYGPRSGRADVPVCPGLRVDIRNPRIAGTAFVDGKGEAELTRFVPPAAQGKTVLFQAVETGSMRGRCAKSIVVPCTFE